VARIRTVKPEFWTNEQLASLSLHARLLAIALLNFSDDEGYFLGNASLVRAACFPFEEDSKNVLGSLQELSRIGYVVIQECSGKTIGKVVKFREHQRIDKPQQSKLIQAFQAETDRKPTRNEENTRENDNSKNIPGTFQESSRNIPRLEREQGTGNREVEQGSGTGEQGMQGGSALVAVEHPSEPRDSPQDVCDYWNLKMGQKCQLTDSRKSKLKTRLRDKAWLDGWREAVDKAAASDFLNGGSDSGWRANLEWFAKPDSAAKILEGGYDNRTKDGYFMTEAQKKLHNSELAGQSFLEKMGGLANTNGKSLRLVILLPAFQSSELRKP